LPGGLSELRIPCEVRKHTKPVENEFDDDTRATGERSAVYLGKHYFEIKDKQLWGNTAIFKEKTLIDQ
jgi:hypothetical protein